MKLHEEILIEVRKIAASGTDTPPIHVRAINRSTNHILFDTWSCSDVEIHVGGLVYSISVDDK